MKTFYLSAVIIVCVVSSVQSQEKLPYYEIPEPAESFTAGTVASRVLDGLGFRYYWATDGLRAEDLAFKPSEEARTSRHTIEHIYGLVGMVLNSTLKKPNGGKDVSEMSFEQLRKETLENIAQASGILRNSDDISQFKIIFKRGENTTEIPFWNQLNGPIGDALWHVGQVVSFRRSSGNPYNSKASVFSGKVRE